jgi:hypothetical protein
MWLLLLTFTCVLPDNMLRLATPCHLLLLFLFLFVPQILLQALWSAEFGAHTVL